MNERIAEVAKVVEGMHLKYSLAECVPQSRMYEIQVECKVEGASVTRNRVLIAESNQSRIHQLFTDICETNTLPTDIEYIAEDYAYEKRCALVTA